MSFGGSSSARWTGQANGVRCIDYWVGANRTMKWDFISFNFGIHDCWHPESVNATQSVILTTIFPPHTTIFTSTLIPLVNNEDSHVLLMLLHCSVARDIVFTMYRNAQPIVHTLLTSTESGNERRLYEGSSQTYCELQRSRVLGLVVFPNGYGGGSSFHCFFAFTFPVTTTL
jgi:hypothetical protein